MFHGQQPSRISRNMNCPLLNVILVIAVSFILGVQIVLFVSNHSISQNIYANENRRLHIHHSDYQKEYPRYHEDHPYNHHRHYQHDNYKTDDSFSSSPVKNTISEYKNIQFTEKLDSVSLICKKSVLEIVIDDKKPITNYLFNKYNILRRPEGKTICCRLNNSKNKLCTTNSNEVQCIYTRNSLTLFINIGTFCIKSEFKNKDTQHDNKSNDLFCSIMFYTNGADHGTP